MAVAKKRKRFFDVDIPLIDKETHLQAFEIDELKGRMIKYDLTRMLKGKSMILISKIKVENDKAISVPREIRLMPYFLRRMVRKGTNYIEDSFIAQCIDTKVRIKPFLITRRKVSRAIRSALRQKTKTELENYLKNKNSEEIFSEILSGQIQKQFSS